MQVSRINNTNTLRFTSNPSAGMQSFKNDGSDEFLSFQKPKKMTQTERLMLNVSCPNKFKRERKILTSDLNVLAYERNTECPDNRIFLDFDNKLSEKADTLCCKSFDNKQLKDLLDFLYLKGNSRQLNNAELTELLNEHFCIRETIKEKKLLYYVPDRKCQLSVSDIIKLAKKSDPELNSIQYYNLLGNIEGRKKDLSVDEALFLSSYGEGIIQNTLKYGLLKDIEGRDTQLSISDAVFWSIKYINSEPYEVNRSLNRIDERKLMTYKFGSDIFDSGKYLELDHVIEFAKLTDDEWDYLHNNDIPEYHESYTPDVVKYLLGLNKSDFEKAKSLISLSVLCDASKIQKIIRLPEDVFNKILKLNDMAYSVEMNADMLVEATKYNDDILGNYAKSYDAAFLKRNQLVVGDDELTDADINDLFEKEGILSAVDLLGDKAFIHSYAMTIDGVEDLIDDVKYMEETEGYTINDHNRLRELLAEKSIPPEDKIQKLLTICRVDDYDTILELMDLIKPNVPSAKMIDFSKKLWSSKDKTFEQKYKMFCSHFKLDKENPKIKNFFDKRASVSPKGAKILYNISTKDIAQLLAVEVVRRDNEKNWDEYINDLIRDRYELDDNDEFFEKVDFSKSKYLSEFLQASDDAEDNIKELFDLIRDNPNDSVLSTLNKLPQNVKVRKLFEDNNIDYDKWVSADKNSYLKLKVQTDVETAKASSIENLEKDLTDADFKALPKEQTEKIFKALKDIGVTLCAFEIPEYNAEGLYDKTVTKMKLMKDDNPVQFEDLAEIIHIIKKEINENDFWTTIIEGNDELDSKRITMYNHFVKLRDSEIKNASELKSDKIASIEIRKADMNDIAYSLFLGNYAGCCTALGSPIGNDFAAARYIMDKFISAVEILDNKNPIGNSMCYVARVDDELALVLDNIELTAKYQNNNSIRDAIIDYAKRICKEIGKSDMPVYAGPFRHKVDMETFPLKEREMIILGDSDGKETYLDFEGEIVVSPKKIMDVSLYKLT